MADDSAPNVDLKIRRPSDSGADRALAGDTGAVPFECKSSFGKEVDRAELRSWDLRFARTTLNAREEDFNAEPVSQAPPPTGPGGRWEADVETQARSG
eukprot:tig00020610_g12062.t1